MEEIYEKICQLYYKLNDTFYCVNGLPNPFTPETIKLSNVSQFISERDEFILRFEHFDKKYINLGIFFNGMSYKYIKLESEKDFDSAMIEIKELLNERNLTKYSELL